MDIHAAIERTRRDLLELSSRNRLIHTPLDGKRSSWLEIHGERSEDIFDILVKQEKAMTFAASTSPEVEQDERTEFLKVFESESPDVTDSEDEREDFDCAQDEDCYTDSVLQTKLSSEKLHDRLLRCLLDAKTSEEEQGVSILFLACGFLKWREANNSKVERFAPLLLIPVELSRNNARSKFRLKFRDDEIITNLSIQARLKQDFGIVLPNIPDAVADEEQWNPSKYFAQINELIEDREGWSIMENKIILWFFSFTKFMMFRDLSPEAWPDNFKLADHPLIQSMLSGGFREDPQLPPSIGENEPLDEKLNVADVVHVTDADSSQAVVVSEIAQGRSLVVQGPPGTGKSQTITNAIAAAVHAGKRVLFVAEKMAALDVVKRRLEQIGLGPMTLELHSHKARKREVLEDLKATIEAGVPTGIKHVPVNELRQIASRLRSHDATLHSSVSASGCTPYQAMGRLLHLRRLGYEALPYKILETADWDPTYWNSCKSLTEDIDKLLKISGNPSNNAWYGITCQVLTPADQERLKNQIVEACNRLGELNAASNLLAEKMNVDSPLNIQEVSLCAQLASTVTKLPNAADRSTLLSDAWQHINRLVTSIDQVDHCKKLNAELGDQVSDIAMTTELCQVRIAIAGYGKSLFRIFNSSYRQSIATLRGILKVPLPTTADERLNLVDQIIELQVTRKKIEQDSDFGRSVLGNLWQGEQTNTQDAKDVVQWMQSLEKLSYVKRHAPRICSQVIDTQVLVDAVKSVAKHLKVCDDLILKIVGELKLDLQKCFATRDPRQVRIVSWQARLSRWSQESEQLSHYLATQGRLMRLSEVGMEPLAAGIEQGSTTAGQVSDRADQIRNEAILERAWQERTELRDFHGDAFEELRKRFNQLDQERIGLSRLEVAKAHYENMPSSSADSGQVSIVRREINKKRKHLPIRELVKQAGHAIQKAKPVFMMSPLSVAQYLPPGSVEFDLLVIDEASQVQPVDARGAVARCKQIVVVGDQRQLPPTNFFGRVTGDVDEDDELNESLPSDLESILGLCEAQGMPSRMLRWHYRSRHESLIAVSNRQFYENRLFIVPSPIITGGPFGLKLRFIHDGCYDRGGTRVNRIEAIAVADAVMDHAKNHPDLSLGVATFSNAQRDAIIDELELRRQRDNSCEEFFVTGGAEPFFVKSLENVQGDQRDVIFISIGYGKDKDGYFSQSFGPLNAKGGERRLNVLISRAAAACEVFTSIKAHDIDLNKTQSEGVAALKMYLNYAEFGRMDLNRSEGEADSIFEEQVAKALRDRGLEVDHQIGVGGFYIDLAIRDPHRNCRYLMGIECDGAQYHSARWVRDRDRLRQ